MARIHELAAKLAATDDADKYRHKQGVKYEGNEGGGYCTIEVLQFLKGRPWNNLALAWVHSLRPSRIRVGGEFTCDSMHNRVTVSMKDDGTISNITQEVSVLYCSGSDLRRITQHQLDGKELEDWDNGKVFYNDKGEVTYIMGPRIELAGGSYLQELE